MIRGEETTNIEYRKRYPWMSFSFESKPSLVHYNHVEASYNKNAKLNIYNCKNTCREGCDILYPYFKDLKGHFDSSEEIKPLILDFHKADEFFFNIVKELKDIHFGIVGQGVYIPSLKNYTYEPFDINIENIFKRYNTFLIAGYGDRNDEFGVVVLEAMSTGGRCVIAELFTAINTKRYERTEEFFIKAILSKDNYDYRKDFELHKIEQDKQINNLLNKIEKL